MKLWKSGSVCTGLISEKLLQGVRTGCVKYNLFGKSIINSESVVLIGNWSGNTSLASHCRIPDFKAGGDLESRPLLS